MAYDAGQRFVEKHALSLQSTEELLIKAQTLYAAAENTSFSERVRAEAWRRAEMINDTLHMRAIDQGWEA